MGSRTAALALAAMLAAPLLNAQAAVPLPPRRTLENLAQDLAKAGWSAEADQVTRVLEDLGHEPAALTALRAALAKLKAKPPKSQGAPDKMAAAVKKAASVLASALVSAGERKEDVARAVLRLDDQAEEAHLALGQRREDGVWVDEPGLALLQRRVAIQDSLARARRLPLELTVETGKHPMFRDLNGVDGCLVRRDGLQMQSEWPPEKTARVVLTALRAYAFAGTLLGNDLAPGKVPKLHVLHVGGQKKYEAALDWLVKNGKLAEKERAAAVRLGGAFTSSGEVLIFEPVEAMMESVILFYLMDQHQPVSALVAGHINWVCRTFLAEPIPLLAWNARTAGAAPSATVTSAEQQEREWRLKLAQAGIAGARAYLAWLAERQQDPPWRRCFVDEIGKLQGEELLKATFACEYCYEHGAFAALWKVDKADAFPAALQKALGVTVEGFDEPFRAWIAPRRGLAQQIATGNRTLPPEETAAMARLNALRRQALGNSFWTVPPPLDVRVDEGLSAGARKHAAYLRQHPEQAAAWPDAHEEYPDHAGFTPEGAWAGGHAVIATEKSLSSAIDAWMGTFYHRLPLLEAGLMQCGLARVGDSAVLDAGSMSVPAELLPQSVSRWPPADAKNVPLCFTPELPNPVPGTDQNTLGYPVTFQYAERYLKGEPLDLALHEGAANGPKVACHLSTPSLPTNPDVVPHNAWCLMPKAHLLPNKTYTVVVELGADGVHEWSFHTAAK